MAINYKEIKRGDQIYWWRVFGHRGGRTYEMREQDTPQERGRKIVRRNVGFWVIDESNLLNQLLGALNDESWVQIT